MEKEIKIRENNNLLRSHLLTRTNDLITKIIQDDELTNEEKIEKIERRYRRDLEMFNDRTRRYIDYRREYIREISTLRETNNELKEKLSIQIPEECNCNDATEAFLNLKILIIEMNETYSNSLFTSTALLSRKFIINIVYALSEKMNIKRIDSKQDLAVDGESKITIDNENDFSFKKAVKWLYFYRFLTRKDYELLDKLRDATNEFNHGISIPKGIEDANKLYLTIKGLVESNFDTHNLYSEENESGENEELSNEFEE